MDEAEIWKRAKAELKEEQAKKWKWIRFFLDKWINAEIELVKARATMKSDWALISEIKRTDNKTKIDIEQRIGQFRTKFWEKADSSIKELHKTRVKYEDMFKSRPSAGGEA